METASRFAGSRLRSGALLVALVAFVLMSSAGHTADSGRVQIVTKRTVIDKLPSSVRNRTWDASSLTVDGSLEITTAEVAATHLVFRGARIVGDLVIRHLPLSVDLSDAVVTGSVWIGDWPNQKNELAFPPTDRDHSRYPDDSEGCWDVPLNRHPASQITLERLQTRGLFLRYVHAGSLLARHADIKDSIFLDHSRFDGFVDLSFIQAFHLELVGASFGKGLALAAAHIDGNVDLACARLGGDLGGLSLQVRGYMQLNGLLPLAPVKPSFDWSFSSFGGLFLRGMNGSFGAINLTNARIGLLDLDYDDTATDIDASLKQHWQLDQVMTRGATIEFVRPAQRMRPGTGDRIGTFARAAERSDDRIYRKLAEAYARDGDEDAANDAWGRYSSLAYILHLPATGALLIVAALLALGAVAGRYRLRKFYGTSRKWPTLDGVLLAFDLLLPGLVDLGIAKRHDAYLKQVSGAEEVAIVVYRLTGWILLASIAAHIAINAGR
jgi:hypothetical protein